MKKIMVVDDEENIRLLYQEELEEAGYTVDVAANGQEALDKLNTFNPDLITLDIKMPGMDGVETLRRIRDVQRDLPVILCSAYGEHQQDLTTWVSDAYVIKTSDLTALKDAIQVLLSKDRSPCSRSRQNSP